jgi:hypothetical protein
LFVQQEKRRRSPSQLEDPAWLEAVGLSEDLKTLRLQLALLQSGCALVADGYSRATSSELLFRARRDFGIDALPSTVGQLLGSLGIPFTTSKGKSRFLLDPEYLQPLLDELSEAIQGMEVRVGKLVTTARDVEARLQPLQERFDQIQARLQRERQMREFIQQYRPALTRNPYLEHEYQQLREQLDRQQRLKNQIHQMQQQLDAQPDLEGKRNILAERVQVLEEQRKDLAQKEKALAADEKAASAVVAQLKQGRAWVNLAVLAQEIAAAEAELEEVKQEIDQHRSWLDRLLRRNEGGNS